MSLLEVLRADRSADGLTVHALIETSNGAFSPEDEYVYDAECVAVLSQQIYEDLPSGDDLSEVATYIESLYLDWQSL